jgi:hypothetical protein
MASGLLERKEDLKEAVKTAGWICSRCIVDATVPGAVFDDEGICNFCKLHQKLEKIFPLNETGARKLEQILSRIKREGRNKKYDCVVGISGGRDSTYTLYLAKRVWGLRPLAVHFNNGFGNPVAGQNMFKAIQRLGVDLRTVTSDWREAKDLKLAFLKASTPDIDASTDIGIAAALYGRAAREGAALLRCLSSAATCRWAPAPSHLCEPRFWHLSAPEVQPHSRSGQSGSG